MCGRGMPSSSTSSSSLATIVVVRGTGLGFMLLDDSGGLYALALGGGCGTISAGVEERGTALAVEEVDNTGEEVAGLVVVTALGIFRGI